MFSRILPVLIASFAFLALAQTEAEACCGPNRSAEFFSHQYHAFKRGHVPGYRHARHRRRY